ncbi:MAG TPA: hypothetical protein VET90_02515 [Candidatus Binatus sp.]|nr:hypothetical protein [Candidatus Binatus sp.]
MPDEQTGAPSGAPAAQMTTTPGGLLTMAAALMLGGWLVFDVILNRDIDPWGALVAAGIALWSRWRPSGVAEPLTRPLGIAVLGAVMFLFGVFSIVFELRQLSLPGLDVLVGLLVFWAAAALGGLAWWRVAS